MGPRSPLTKGREHRDRRVVRQPAHQLAERREVQPRVVARLADEPRRTSLSMRGLEHRPGDASCTGCPARTVTSRGASVVVRWAMIPLRRWSVGRQHLERLEPVALELPQAERAPPAEHRVRDRRRARRRALRASGQRWLVADGVDTRGTRG